jgi:WbqC-like protein family
MHLHTAYLPLLPWCALFWQAETVTLEAQEHYQKGSIRNRTQIVGPNGVQRLSIPLAKGKHQQTPIREVRIAYDEPWQRQHWRSIQTAYGSAPYFEHYAEALHRFYDTQTPFLFDFNLALLEFILVNKMGWKGTIQFSSMYEPLPAPGYNHLQTVKYPQVFEDRHGFIPQLSILDLLFCYGKNGGDVLQRMIG